jgi:hypothetical protein
MANCPFCDHFNRTGATYCEKCKAPLQTAIPQNSESSDSESSPKSAEAPLPGTLEADILELMRTHQKIEAIKLYRQHRKADLKEAKDFVEALAAKEGIAPSSGGCAGAILLMIVAGAAATGAAWTLVGL